MKWFGVVFFGLLGALLFFLYKQFPYAFHGKDSYLNAIQTIFFLVVLVLGLMRSNLSLDVIFKWGSAWLCIMIVIITGYSYQWEIKKYFSNILGRLVPSIGQINKDGSVTFAASENGHFMIDAKVNEQIVHFLLDTGASKITLPLEDARSVGINTEVLSYDIPVSTAKGTNMVAYVQLKSIQVGNIVVRDIDAYVSKEGLSGALLGTNFLNKLSRYEVGNGSITFWGPTQ